MHGTLDASSLLSLVSRPVATPVSLPVQGSAASALTGLHALLAAADQAGLSPTSLFLSALARRDRGLAARARRTAEWARLLAASVEPAAAGQDAHDVALLADIGQLALGPGPTPSPWAEWQRRRASHDLLCGVPSLSHLAIAVLSVGERFDGDGLPFGLLGEEIPRAARIARLVRDFDLASGGWWPGHPAAVSARACAELVALAGHTLDPALVHAWLGVLDRELAAAVA